MQTSASPSPVPVYVSELLEDDGTPIKCLSARPFQHQEGTAADTPGLTCFPRTKAGVGAVVRWAASNGKRVRCAGRRRTCTSLHADDDEVLISLLPRPVVAELPAVAPTLDPDDELQGIALIGYVVEGGVRKALCRIGAGATNEQFRRWCLDAQGGWDWTLLLNLTLVEITLGGGHAPVCHGAGWRHPTLSDLVTEIEFVNGRGEIQTVRYPTPRRSAADADAFGLLGIVTALTLKLDPITHAAPQPARARLAAGA